MSAALSAEVVASLSARESSAIKVETNQVANLALNVSSGGIQSGQHNPVTVYRLIEEKGRWSATVAPDSISLETPQYGRWKDDFRERFLALMEIVQEKLRPAVTVRLGLRYVDVLSVPNISDAQGWQGFVRPEFLGPLQDPGFAPCVLLTQQQMTLEISENLKAILRHGMFRDGDQQPEIRYLVDTDVYQESFSRFNIKEIESLLDPMHNASKQLFQYVITPEFYERLASDDDGV